MTARALRLPSTRRARAARGSILIYVLWILAVISILAFQLSAASRATVLNQSAYTSQLKRQMQLESAIQFAIFKIEARQWQDRQFKFGLNGQDIVVNVFNESGFVSLYDRESSTLERIFEYTGLAAETIDAIGKAVRQDQDPRRLNSFDELRRFDGIDEATLQRLIPLVSIFHEDSVNPVYAPVNVLMRLERVDQYRVQKIRESDDEAEIEQLRREVVESLLEQEGQFAEGLSPYYRVLVGIDGMLYRVFLKYDRKQKRHIVVLVDNSQSSTGGDQS